MEYDNEPKAHSYFEIEVTPELLTSWQNMLQLKKQTTVSGQTIFLPVRPGITLRYTPENKPKFDRLSGLIPEPPSPRVV
jgi:hypothetical protein